MDQIPLFTDDDVQTEGYAQPTPREDETVVEADAEIKDAA